MSLEDIQTAVSSEDVEVELDEVEAVLKHFGHDLNTPLEDMEDEVINTLLYGSNFSIGVNIFFHLNKNLKSNLDYRKKNIL